MSSEKTFKRRLVSVLRDQLPGSVIFSHNERIVVGVPDLSVTWNGRTVWLELKLFPVRWSSGAQELSVKRLARAGLCFVVLYDVRHDVTEVIDPEAFEGPEAFETLSMAKGIDHHFVADFVKERLA